MRSSKILKYYRDKLHCLNEQVWIAHPISRYNNDHVSWLMILCNWIAGIWTYEFFLANEANLKFQMKRKNETWESVANKCKRTANTEGIDGKLEMADWSADRQKPTSDLSSIDGPIKHT